MSSICHQRYRKLNYMKPVFTRVQRTTPAIIFLPLATTVCLSRNCEKLHPLKKTMVCLSCVVNVSRQQHRPQGSDTGKTRCQCCKHGLCGGSLQQGKPSVVAYVLSQRQLRSVWKPTQTCYDCYRRPWPLTLLSPKQMGFRDTLWNICMY